MTIQPQPTVEPCFLCGQPAERPAVGEGVVADHEETRVPLRVDCLALALHDQKAFWQGLRERGQGDSR